MHCRQPRIHSVLHYGFTLLEILIASFIISIISLLSWSLLSSFIETKKHLYATEQPINEAEKIFSLLEHDLEQVLTPIASSNKYVFTGRSDTDQTTMSFYRMTMSSESPIWVRYRYYSGELRRQLKPIDKVTRANDENEDNLEDLIAANLTDFKIRFWSDPTPWVSEWPIKPEAKFQSPRGVEIILSIKGYASPLRRLVVLP